jgi:beta-lactam-binding protein with PASTA domain
MLLAGAFRDRLERPGRPSAGTAWQRNLVVYRALDLIGELLCNRPGLAGITHLAVGAGDPGWDANPPAPDRGRTALTAEVYRVRLEPGRNVTYDAATGRVHVRVSIGRGKATGTLRELGLFGGTASARPGSGYLVNHKAHAPIEKEEGDTLERELRLTLDPALLPGARDVIGGLLANREGLTGISHVALGTSSDRAGEPVRDLIAEAYRKPLDPARLAYDASSHTVVANARFDIVEGPSEVREAGLLGGSATDRRDTGYLLLRETAAPVSRARASRLERNFRLVLVERTEVSVPDVVGESLAAARAALTATDLLVGRVTDQESDADAPGTVLAQGPPPGGAVNEGTPVALVVAVPPLVTVPEIVGEPEARAKTLLKRIGLQVDDAGRAEVASGRAAGTLLASVPPPGAKVPKGSSIVLTVAVPARVRVPDVRGRTPAAAALVLASAKLAAAPGPYPTRESGATPGSVVAQDPQPGADAAVGSEVRLTVAVPWTIEIPDLNGRTPAEAAALLAEAAAALVAKLGLESGPQGLALGTVTERDDAAAPGTIVEQRPAALQRASLYSTVDVVVAATMARRVPGLRRLDQGAAMAALAAAGFALGKVVQRAADAPVGTIVGQEPEEGVEWPAGARVTLVVAAARQALVPDLVGLTLEAAREAVTARELVLADPTPKVEPGPPGVVLSQNPAARQSVAAGTRVKVVVRSGVPSVVGMSEADARSAIAAAGVPLGNVTTREVEGPPGVVLAQKPAAGSPIGPATRVDLVVSARPRVEVPDLAGSFLDDAQRRLTEIGLVLGDVGKEESDAAEGSVLAQTPGAGERVERGTAVAVTIAVARPQTVTVPDVRGLTVKKAKAVLGAAQLVIEVKGIRPVAGVVPDTVVAQDPEAGATAPPGSVVFVVLAAADTSLEVPDVRGLTVDEAAARLAEAGLGLEAVDKVSSAEPPGTVLKQDPPPGSRVPAGSVVSVVLSAGGLVVVPDLVGVEEAVALKTLARRGLRGESVGQFDLQHAPGTVIGQEPGAGSEVPAESVVRLAVARRELPPVRPFEVVPLPGPIEPVIPPPVVVPGVIRPPRIPEPIGPIIRPVRPGGR